jgi:pSer/pThr/pTyr-binding forkhead associated (FHA) protein
MWKLVIEDDEGKRTVVPLTRDGYTVGRKEGNTIRLTERNVSREHARIRRSNGAIPGHYALEDLHSYNGVFVNGMRVNTPHELQHGDLIQIGDYRMILQDEGVTEEAPPPVKDTKSTLPTGVVNRGSLLLERPNRFVMLAGPTPGMEYPLERERITLGRAEDCTISINHNSVSRVHCEIHSLGEGRFEIVDKGSSNGVRVNGRELKRGIVEAGDIIELGDVRFRFVGAGQVFLPGVNDSQQLMAIGDRVAEEALKPKATGTVTGYIALGAFAAVLLVAGGWYLMVQRQQQQAQNNPDLPQNREAAALATAKKMCAEQNDCLSAHDEVMAHISDGSPLRLSADFKFIETHWADQLLERAAAEPDDAKKRSMLRQIEQATSVDDDRRKLAATRLRELDAIPIPTGSAPTTSVSATTPPPPSTTVPINTAPPTVSTTKPPPPTSTTVVKPPPSHTATVKPPVQSPFDKARQLYLAHDLAGARQILEPRVFSHQASAEEAKFLKDICKEQGDKACKDKISQMYPQ